MLVAREYVAAGGLQGALVHIGTQHGEPRREALLAFRLAQQDRQRVGLLPVPAAGAPNSQPGRSAEPLSKNKQNLRPQPIEHVGVAKEAAHLDGDVLHQALSLPRVKGQEGGIFPVVGAARLLQPAGHPPLDGSAPVLPQVDPSLIPQYPQHLFQSVGQGQRAG